MHASMHASRPASQGRVRVASRGSEGPSASGPHKGGGGVDPLGEGGEGTLSRAPSRVRHATVIPIKFYNKRDTTKELIGRLYPPMSLK
eukprot:1190007-Prorocentrum_minimum.AAC.1